MVSFKYYIASQLLGKKVHLKCDCLIPLDCIGIIKDFEINNKNQEIIFIIEVNNKFIKIGENHPNLFII